MARSTSAMSGSSTITPAAHTAERATSVRIQQSASRCFTPWNEPIGRPNCSRSFAYSTASAVLPDEFPLNVFYEALRKKLADVIESTQGITGAAA